MTKEDISPNEEADTVWFKLLKFDKFDESIFVKKTEGEGYTPYRQKFDDVRYRKPEIIILDEDKRKKYFSKKKAISMAKRYIDGRMRSRDAEVEYSYS